MAQTKRPIDVRAELFAAAHVTLSAEGVALGETGLRLGDVVGRWCDDATSATLFDKCRDEADLRCIVQVRRARGPELSLKICRNAFTTADKIAELARGEAHYATLGVPCQQVVPALDGALAAQVDGFLCYAETWVEGQIAREVRDEIDEEALTDEAYVQGDTNWSNLVVDGRGRLAGLIDFNLAGMERCLNYLFAEASEWPEEPAELNDPQACRARDDVTRRRLALVGETYAFTDAERELFPALYRLRTPTWWPVFTLLTRCVDEGQGAAVVERESTRPDAEVLALLPGGRA